MQKLLRDEHNGSYKCGAKAYKQMAALKIR